MRFRKGLAAILALLMIVSSLPFGTLTIYGAEEGLVLNEDEIL